MKLGQYFPGYTDESIDAATRSIKIIRCSMETKLLLTMMFLLMIKTGKSFDYHLGYAISELEPKDQDVMEARLMRHKRVIENIQKYASGETVSQVFNRLKIKETKQ